MSSTRRSFFVFGATGVAVAAGLNRLLAVSPHEFNERVTRALLGVTRLAPLFDRSRAAEPRANGMVGLDEEVGEWRLKIEAPGQARRELDLKAVQAMPRVEMTTELMCVEGWSEIVHWTGTPLRHLAPSDAPGYVSLSTPDGSYYVGLDRESALHPQTLLAWEMNGKPLTSDHGAPLRLVIPVKYGIKNIKRVGTIQFTAQRPADYWAERGYDWFAGL